MSYHILSSKAVHHNLYYLLKRLEKESAEKPSPAHQQHGTFNIVSCKKPANPTDTNS
jgi:hypothetical protein